MMRAARIAVRELLELKRLCGRHREVLEESRHAPHNAPSWDLYFTGSCFGLLVWLKGWSELLTGEEGAGWL